MKRVLYCAQFLMAFTFTLFRYLTGGRSKVEAALNERRLRSLVVGIDCDRVGIMLFSVKALQIAWISKTDKAGWLLMRGHADMKGARLADLQGAVGNKGIR